MWHRTCRMLKVSGGFNLDLILSINPPIMRFDYQITISKILLHRTGAPSLDFDRFGKGKGRVLFNEGG